MKWPVAKNRLKKKDKWKLIRNFNITINDDVNASKLPSSAIIFKPKWIGKNFIKTDDTNKIKYSLFFIRLKLESNG